MRPLVRWNAHLEKTYYSLTALRAQTKRESGDQISLADVIGNPVKRLADLLLSLPAVFGGSLCFLAVLVLRTDLWPNYESDIWWQAAVGRDILASAAVPRTDPYSFTAQGTGWMAYEWLADAGFALLHSGAGLDGWMLLRVSLTAILLVLLFYYSVLRTGNLLASYLGTVLLFRTAAHFCYLRPQLIGFVFLAGLLVLLERYRQGRSAHLWALPVLTLVWVNTHGSFVIGMVVLGWFWLTTLKELRFGRLVTGDFQPRQRRHVGGVLLLCMLALAVTPYGIRLAIYPFQFAMLQLPSVPEWGPPDFRLALWIFFGFLAALVLLGLALSKEIRLFDSGLVALFLSYALLHRRFAILFVIIAAPTLAALIGRFVPNLVPQQNHPHKQRLLHGAFLAAFLFGIFLIFPSEQDHQQAIAASFPVGAVEYLQQHPIPAGLFNDYRWGSYLIWALGPSHKVFIDGRTDLYESAGILSDYVEIAGLNNPLERLRKYGVVACLIEPGTPLADFLESQPNWEVAYRDEGSVLFRRQ